MAKDIFRKARPEPPKWFWLYSDSCYDCNRKKHGCNSCKRLKKYKKQRIVDRKGNRLNAR